jgi:cytochrome P450
MTVSASVGHAPIESPLDAVVHAEPYAYYARLVEERPFYFDANCGYWVASSAEAVRRLLLDTACRVRPPAEPVPKAIRGSAVGDVFGHLVRMLDGPAHERLKLMIASVLACCDLHAAGKIAAATTRMLLRRESRHYLDSIMYEMPGCVVATLCGLADDASHEAGRLIGAFVRCLTGPVSPEQLAHAARAAQRLGELLSAAATPDGGGLMGDLARAAGAASHGPQAWLVANGIGLLSQTYDATAGLIGNTLVALARHGAARRGAPGDLEQVVREVLRHDPPVQNTRRYAAGPLKVLGVEVPEDAHLLLVLAAANRDPAANQRPHEFDPYRENPVLFAFGAGAHRCPGEGLAVTIATTAVRTLLESGFDPMTISPDVSYRPSANARIPVLQSN